MNRQKKYSRLDKRRPSRPAGQARRCVVRCVLRGVVPSRVDVDFPSMGRSSTRSFPSVPYASKEALTNSGLAYWRRPLRESAYAREFLLTVALEGGFPVRILAEGARGWLKEYLRAIMRRAIAWRVDTPAEILAIAEEERGRMRKSYQHDDFVALCSELVTSLLELRQKAEAESATAFATQRFSMPSIRAGATNCRSTFRPRMKPLSPSC